MSSHKDHTPQMNYFKEDNILHLLISEEVETVSVEISPNITAELNGEGELIGVEILNASTYIGDTVLEAVQARLSSLSQKLNQR